jgi:hypothetical protein
VSNAYRVALATLRRATEALADPALDADERARVRADLDATLRLLEASADRRRLATPALVERVARLERQLASVDPAERRAAVCRRLGVSRSTYYRLRRFRQSQ